MDPVIAVLLQAAAALGSTMLDETAKRAVTGAWDTALAAIKRHLGPEHPAPVLAEKLRLAGNVKTEVEPLRERLSTLQLGDHTEVLMAVQPLVSALNRQGSTVPTVYANVINGAGVVRGDQTNYFR